ncbi:AraC family transcriptional regulator [Pendulispora albinea]|uniref:AraC family transcriptional regulator n=1 Tax=Pendulispora albinea TaxID=2741071 RepID=A0ABZ2LL22_9BACT
MIRSQFLALLFGWMRANGAGKIATDIWHELYLPEPNGGMIEEISVPLVSYRAVSDLAAERLGDPFLGLHVAQGTPRGSYGILEYAVRNAPNVAEGFARTVQYLGLLSETVRLEARTVAGEFIIAHHVPGEPSCVGRHGNEFTMAIFHRFVRELTESPVCATRVELAHEAPPDISELEAHFGTTNIHFGMKRNQLVLDEQILTLPIVTHDETLLPWLDRCAETLLPSRSDDDEDPVPHVREKIRRCLHEHKAPSLPGVAWQLRMSPRTLQRRLAATQRSFASEVDEVRRELVESYLREPELNIDAIASLLGYAGRRGFERAILRWYGTTARKLRRERLTMTQ